MKDILVTAFEAFGGEQLNPTEKVLEMLPDNICSCRISKLLLPVEFVRSRLLAAAEYDRLSPAALIMLGQAGGRSAVTPETTARNIINASVPDNSGYKPDNLPVEKNGPYELYSSFPAEKIMNAVSALGFPCEISDNAGQYVCNTLLYGMLAHNKGAVPTGFIHVPYIREQQHQDKPFMELNDICRAVTAAIKVVTEELQPQPD